MGFKVSGAVSSVPQNTCRWQMLEEASTGLSLRNSGGGSVAPLTPWVWPSHNWFWTSGLQNYKRVHFCCFKPHCWWLFVNSGHSKIWHNIQVEGIQTGGFDVWAVIFWGVRVGGGLDIFKCGLRSSTLASLESSLATRQLRSHSQTYWIWIHIWIGIPDAHERLRPIP